MDIFKSRKRLIAENIALRRRLSIQRAMLEKGWSSFQQGFDTAMQVNRSEMQLLHKEIQELNDLLGAK